MWMKEMQIRVEGGEGMQGLRQNDMVLADLVQEPVSRYILASGCWCLEMWRVSEAFTASGEVRYQLLNGEWEDVATSVLTKRVVVF